MDNLFVQFTITNYDCLNTTLTMDVPKQLITFIKLFVKP